MKLSSEQVQNVTTGLIRFYVKSNKSIFKTAFVIVVIANSPYLILLSSLLA